MLLDLIGMGLSFFIGKGRGQEAEGFYGILIPTREPRTVKNKLKHRTLIRMSVALVQGGLTPTEQNIKPSALCPLPSAFFKLDRAAGKWRVGGYWASKVAKCNFQA